MKVFYLFLFLFVSSVGFSQKEANIWYFGQNAGLDFNSGVPVPLLDGALATDEGCATLSDENGNLLFYTDGITVWNKDHIIMLNGTGLNGNPSSTHSAIIVPKPGDPNIYFLFTVDFQANTNGLQYSEVDMTLDGGLGGITANKNILLHTPTTEKLTAIKSDTSNEYWVVSHKWNSNEFIAYRISAAGINTTPIVSAVGNYIGGTDTNTIGQIKISPDATKLAVARSEELSEVQLFDFNNLTGIVSNPINLLNYIPANKQVYGIEFSPNSKVLYVSVLGVGVHQFNLEAGSNNDIINSDLIVSPEAAPYAALQLATNGKIYIAKGFQLYLDVIDNPNVVGTGCNYQFEHLYLEGRRSQAGLPPFIQSFFNVAFQTDDVCFGESTVFTAINLPTTYDSLVWDFGDGNTSTLENPSHVYANDGDYTASLTVTVGGNSSTDTKELTIYEQPTATQPQDILECDTNNNGFFEFDLTTQDINILNGQAATTFEVVYYASMLDYTNNAPIVNSTTYTNTTAYAPENIIASVRNRGNVECEAITDFNIQVFDIPIPSLTIPPIEDCDNNSYGTDADGVILFDLTQHESIILNGQSITDFTINYYTDSGLANQIPNPSAYQNTNAVETIYVQVTNNTNTICNAQTQFTIEVLELPVVNSVVNLRQCDDDIDGYSVFNLNEANNEISLNAVNETITYYETQLDAVNENSPIPNTVAYSNQNVSTDIVWARVENNNGCYRTAQINLFVSTTQIPITFTRDFYQCDDGVDSTDGVATFDFSSITNEIESLFPSGQQLIINYYKNQDDALSEIDPILNISNYENTGYPINQDIFIRVDSALDNDCLGLGDHITLHVEPVPVAYSVTFDEQCDDDGDGMYAFDTSSVESTLLNGQTNITVRYTDANGNVLASPLPSPFLTASQTITASVTNSTSQDPDGACYDETTISFVVDQAAEAHPIDDLVVCDDNNDGEYAFDTTTIQDQVLNGQTGMIVTYYNDAGMQLPSPLPNPFISATQTITVRVENVLSTFCYDETMFDVVVIEQPVLTMDELWSICEGDSVEIIADTGYDEYLWSTGETTQSITVDSSGLYEVTVANIYGSFRCETSKEVTVVESNIATITNIETVDWTQNNNEITIFVEGNGDYEYSIDSINYQDSNVFSYLEIDEYTVYVRDKNGCGISMEEVYLMYYPKVFTPNGDGTNDNWQLYGSKKEPNNIVFIYDRYGKLLKQINPNSYGWDGTFNGSNLPNSDYWFVLKRQNGKEYRGHFSLKR